MLGNFSPRASVFYKKLRKETSTVHEQIFDLKPYKHLTSTTFLFNNLFGKDFRNKSFTICFTSSLANKLPFLSLPGKLRFSRYI